jgi:hypothetical protein
MNIEQMEKKEIEAPVVISDKIHEVDPNIVANDDHDEEKLAVVEDDNKEASSEEQLEKQEGGDVKKHHMKVAADAPWSERMWEVFSTFWPLGLIAFGGPQVSSRSHMLMENMPVCMTHHSCVCLVQIDHTARPTSLFFVITWWSKGIGSMRNSSRSSLPLGRDCPVPPVLSW